MRETVIIAGNFDTLLETVEIIENNYSLPLISNIVENISMKKVFY